MLAQAGCTTEGIDVGRPEPFYEKTSFFCIDNHPKTGSVHTKVTLANELSKVKKYSIDGHNMTKTMYRKSHDIITKKFCHAVKITTRY